MERQSRRLVWWSVTAQIEASDRICHWRHSQRAS